MIPETIATTAVRRSLSHYPLFAETFAYASLERRLTEFGDIDPFPSDDEIAERAYELAFLVRDADRLGSYIDVAEAELLDRAARRALLALRPGRGRTR